MPRGVSISRKLLMKPVLVRWLDHEGHGAAWMDLKDLPEEPAMFETVGFLLKVGAITVVLGSTLDVGKTMTGDTTVLVRSCIVDVVPLSP